jgi:hypothetical protein
VKLSGASSWYNSSWKYRKKITFDNRTSTLGTTSEALTNFPVLVTLDGSRVDYTNTQNSGQDIRFTDSDGTTLLSYEIEKWNEAANSYVWVKVPQIDFNSNTDYIYMYYGNAGASDAQSPNNVWDANFLGVWHGSDTVGTSVVDSTINNKVGTKASSTQPAPQSLGVIAGAQTYTQGTSRIGTTINNTLGDFSVEVWFKDDGVVTSYERLADKSYSNCFWLGRNNSLSNTWGGGVREGSDPYGIYVTHTYSVWYQT